MAIPLTVRLPEGLHAALKDAAVANHRSLQGEILARLEASEAKLGRRPQRKR